MDADAPTALRRRNFAAHRGHDWAPGLASGTWPEVGPFLFALRLQEHPTP